MPKAPTCHGAKPHRESGAPDNAGKRAGIAAAISRESGRRRRGRCLTAPRTRPHSSPGYPRPAGRLPVSGRRVPSRRLFAARVVRGKRRSWREARSGKREAVGARRKARGAKREALGAYRLALTGRRTERSQHNSSIFRYLTCVKNRGALWPPGNGVAIHFVSVLCVVNDLTAEHFEGIVGARVFEQDPFAAKLRPNLFDCHLLFHCAVNLLALI